MSSDIEYPPTTFEGLPPGQLLVAGLQWLERAAYAATHGVQVPPEAVAIDAAIGRGLIEAARAATEVSTGLIQAYSPSDPHA